MKTETYEVTINTDADGYRYEKWEQDGALHRLDGPAVSYLYSDDTRCEQWFQHDKRHRLNGPAYIYTYADGTSYEEWWQNGVKIISPKDEEDSCAGRVVNIDGREYRLEPVT